MSQGAKKISFSLGSAPLSAKTASVKPDPQSKTEIYIEGNVIKTFYFILSLFFMLIFKKLFLFKKKLFIK